MIENQDEFDQKRFIIAMVVSGLILVLWQIFFAPPPPAPIEGGDAAVTKVGQTGGEGQPVKLSEEPKAGEPSPQPAEDLPVVEHQIKSSDFVVTLSSKGARVTSVEIKQPEQYAAEGNLLKAFPKDTDYFPFGISFTQNSIALRRGLVWAFVPEASTKEGETYSRVTYRHVDPSGRFSIDKTYALSKTRTYMLDLEIAVKNHLDKGVIADRLALDLMGYHDPSVERSFLDMMPDSLEAICKLDDDIEREIYDSVDNPLSFDEQRTVWGAVGTRYFLFAALPLEPAQKCIMERVDEYFLRTRIVQPEFAIQPGSQTVLKYQLFAGPKDYDKLEEVGAGLSEAVDFGVLTFLARPLRWLLVVFYGWLGNWGLAIILLTLVIRILTWPINQKVYVNSEKMKEVQPALNAIKEKYKDDQQRQAEETMKVWKEKGVSPLGCLPMFLQFPILLALYFMILNSVELYQANFAFWYTDLSAPDPWFVLPILMVVVMVVQQSFMTVDTGNPQMVLMMKIMPAFFGLFMLFLPSGVVLYYFVSLLLGLVQQYLIKRMYRAKAATA